MKQSHDGLQSTILLHIQMSPLRSTQYIHGQGLYTTAQCIYKRLQPLIYTRSEQCIKGKLMDQPCSLSYLCVLVNYYHRSTGLAEPNSTIPTKDLLLKYNKTVKYCCVLLMVIKHRVTRNSPQNNHGQIRQLVQNTQVRSKPRTPQVIHLKALQSQHKSVSIRTMSPSLFIISKEP